MALEEKQYAGDISPPQAWQMLEEIPQAVLVDVRTAPEWSFVGVPDLGILSKSAIFLEWQQFPAMAVNADFSSSLVVHLEEQGHEADDPILFICRSGARSRSATIALSQEGYGQCFNITGGFEGDADAHHHRSTVNGWKVAGLPWRQQ
ncbi:MAG: rhodanese-like domain-containing protein [Parvularculales bacterium]